MPSPQLIPVNRLDNTAKTAFSLLWHSYIQELAAYSQRVAAEPPSPEEIDFMWWNPDAENYFVVLDDEIVGFLLLGINENKHEDSDWFIGEFYIAKSRQLQGVGKRAIGKPLKQSKGRYCLFILEKNIRASRFWEEIFVECGYEDVSECFLCENTPEDAVFKMYSPAHPPILTQ